MQKEGEMGQIFPSKCAVEMPLQSYSPYVHSCPPHVHLEMVSEFFVAIVNEWYSTKCDWKTEKK